MNFRTIITVTTCLVVSTACADKMRDTSSGTSGGTSVYSTGSNSSASSSARTSSSMPSFSSFDANRDGVISAEEANRGSGLSKETFIRIDKDFDGKVTQVEYDSFGGTSPNDQGAGSSGAGGTGAGAGSGSAP